MCYSYLTISSLCNIKHIQNVFWGVQIYLIAHSSTEIGHQRHVCFLKKRRFSGTLRSSVSRFCLFRSAVDLEYSVHASAGHSRQYLGPILKPVPIDAQITKDQIETGSTCCLLLHYKQDPQVLDLYTVLKRSSFFL